VVGFEGNWVGGDAVSQPIVHRVTIAWLQQNLPAMSLSGSRRKKHAFTPNDGAGRGEPGGHFALGQLGSVGEVAHSSK
jgi:hypothetical protein